jgi:signal transduction histidine kinase
MGLPIPLRALNRELAARLVAVIPRVLARRLIEENIDVVVRNSSDDRILLVSVFPLPAGSLGLVARDITEFHRAQEGRRQARRAEMIQQLAAGIAHDFNNLLTTILANASLIAESPQATGVADYAREILGAGERAAELTRWMLAYSGKGAFVKTDVNLTALVQAAEPRLRATMPRNVTLRTRLAADLPALRADPTQLIEILNVLIRNSAEAIGDIGAGIIEVETRPISRDSPEHRRLGESVYLEVSDTGGGIDEDVLPKIFDPFFSTKFPGRGLGLAAAKGIVSASGGEIQVQSSRGAGTSFRVILPLVAHECLNRQPV